MRVRVRRALAAVAAMTVLIVGLPAGAAYSDGDRSCDNELPAGTPEFVQCTWLNRPEEARDVALFWLAGDGANMEAAQPGGGRWFRCDQATGDACLPADAQGDGGVHDGDSAAPEDYVEPEGRPTCDPPGTDCYVSPGGVTAEQVAEAARTPAGQAVATATGLGLRPWIETELVDDWKAGERALAAEAARVAALAMQPGVAGIRFTSQLGYNDALRTPEEVRRFVTEASAALRKAAPGRRLAVHTVVPEFGCGTNAECVAAMRERYPLLVPADIEAYLKTGAVDQLNLDSGLFASAYRPWGISADQAARNQWIKVRALAWDALVQIGAEDAGFAGPRPLTADEAKSLAADRVATPLKDGAATVTLWTRWQDGAGEVHRVLGERLADTPAWEQLTGLRPLQRRLATIYDPAAPEVSVAEDLKKLAEVFSQVYVTA
jgi:hypothetical protein